MCKWGNDIKIERHLNKNGKPFYVDECIAPLIQVLNDNGFPTIASCCGHGKQPSSIIFKLDGKEKEIRIMTFGQARKVDKVFPPIN